jgi:hypothetical protein
MPPAESLRGLGPLTQKHLRGLVLSFLENPTSGTVNHPLFFITWVTGTVGAAIAEMNMLLMINVHGSETFQQPRNFPKQMLEHSFVLNRITCAGSTQAHPTGQKLPPAPLDGQHLSEWREAADYAATTLAVLAGIVDLETSSFKSPLLGGFRMVDQPPTCAPLQFYLGCFAHGKLILACMILCVCMQHRGGPVGGG